MAWKWFKAALVCSLAVMAPSCGHDPQLVSIAITPSGFVFEGIGARGQFTALGTYIHPPVTKDISNKVVWKVDVSYLATITQTGQVTGLSVCGSGDVTATYYSNPANPTAGTVIIGTATIKGVDDGTAKCMP